MDTLNREIIACRRCPRLINHMAALAPRRGLSRGDYWGRPVPGFGDNNARICLIGLAPGGHGANRTGRPFTGDGAGDFMYPLLHAAGLASQPRVWAADDGLRLDDLYISNAVKCLPPANRPSSGEFSCCRSYLLEELSRLPRLQVIIALGQGAYTTLLHLFREQGLIKRLADHRFGHGVEFGLGNGWRLVGSYHTSRYNVQTGRITGEMFAALLRQVQSRLV